MRFSAEKNLKKSLTWVVQNVTILKYHEGQLCLFGGVRMFLTSVEKGAKTVVGVKQTLKIIVNGNAKIVAVASDANSKIIEPVKAACAECGVGCEEIATMEKLGKLCGIKVGAATAVVLKS